MPPPSSQLPVGRYLLSLAGLLVIVYSLVFFTGNTATPKLGLDLQGGTTVTLKAQTQNGKPPSKEDLDTARGIIDNRVNGLGVSSAQVQTQGNDQIVISVPGKNGQQAKQLGSTAQLFFRAALAAPIQVGKNGKPVANTPTTSPSGSNKNSQSTPSNSPSPSSSPSPSNSSSPSSSSTPSSSPSPSSSSKPQGAPVPQGIHENAAPAAKATTAAPTATPLKNGNNQNNSGQNNGAVQAPAGWPKKLIPDISKSCDQLSKIANKAGPKQPVVVCTEDGKEKYALAPALFKGTEVKSASARYDPQQGWNINLDLKSHGSTVWADYTSKHNKDVAPETTQYVPANHVGFVLDGRLLGDPPQIQGTINGTTQITGQFSADRAKTLAADFKYGALPLSFTTSQAQTISATLGTTQLKAGLLAGGIGLILVVFYALLYYRALGVVTVFSLVISGLLVYACIVLLGRQLGFTLTLAGIAGLIVSVGITADSFVVFFERLKEEVREGRTMRSGVPRAWERARRTILSADAVSFLAAAVLYYLAAGDVRGFAFTLGLSTILDLVVVFLFTHPLVSLAARSPRLSSPRWSGLGSVRPHRTVAATAGSGSTAAERAAQRYRNRVTKGS